eukprot:gene14161-11011_t
MVIVSVNGERLPPLDDHLYGGETEAAWPVDPWSTVRYSADNDGAASGHAELRV